MAEYLDRINGQAQFSFRVQQIVNKIAEADGALGQFFTERVEKTKGFKFYVKKGGRPVAVDINPAEKGNLNAKNKSTAEFFIPPTFDEKVAYTAFEEFEPTLGADDEKIDGEIYKVLAEKTAEEMAEIINMMKRREELQRAEALQTGVVTLKNGDNIDFGRKAESLVAYNASFGWDVGTNDPGIIIKQGIQFLIKIGLFSAGGRWIMLAGENAFDKFKNNPIRQAQGDIKDQKYMTLSTGENIKGLTPQGSYSAGNFNVDIWGYEGYFDDPDNNDETTPFLDPNKIIIMPASAMFEMVYCGTKGWKGNPYSSSKAKPRIIKAKRNYYELRKIEECAEHIGVRSAFTASLKDVDAVFTATVTQ